MAIGTSTALLIGTGISAYSSYKAQEEMQEANEDLTRNQLELQQAQQARLDEQMESYKQFQFKNPYAGMQNMYANMENAYEDLTVSTQAADFQMEQGAQQRANILQTLRGAAGASGIAGLAQTMAGQGALQARQVSADISQQETRNAAMRAQGTMSLQQLERQGASAVDMAMRGGEAMVQEAEMSRQATLLGVEYGSMAGANTALQQARANEAQGNAIAAQMQQDRWNTLTNVGMGLATSGDFSGLQRQINPNDPTNTTGGGLNIMDMLKQGRLRQQDEKYENAGPSVRANMIAEGYVPKNQR